MKKKDDTLIFQFINKEHTNLLKCKMNAIPLREDTLLRLSEEFFGDPEPCMIHRSAVMNRMFIELHQYFQMELVRGKSEYTIAELPERLVSFIDIKDAYKIIVEKN